MESKNRFLRLTLIGVAACWVSVAVACGLDEGGIVDGLPESGVPDTLAATDASGEAGPADVVQPDTSPPPSCADASACLPEFDGGWSPYLLVLSGSCPTGWINSGYVITPIAIDPSACTCTSCLPVGAACSDPKVAFGSSSCTGKLDATVPFNGCLDLGVSYYLQDGGGVSASTPLYSASCSQVPGGNLGWDASAAHICSTTDCMADFCGASKTNYKKCILASGTATCPTGFLPAVELGAPGSFVTCGGCSACSSTGTCGGTLVLSDQPSCGTDSGAFDASACSDAGGLGVRSVRFAGTGPTQSSCNPGSSLPTANTGGPQTLCCVN